MQQFMDSYFVVLELPSSSLSLLNVSQNKSLWASAKDLLKSGSAVIVSSRRDTGVCEELKNYLSHITDFTTFILLQTALNPADLISKDKLFPKLASSIDIHAPVEVVDFNAKFQVLAQA